ncbi:hypothetical protein CYMTET_24734 [Cymbomonas tetramitiformis]|uniref:Uncharacterized protein n=1 Tax=Cymbomonas tetramitiformis TaxID=36881 RepID=A0AAE0KZN3_9CHLO|nr:hypothetical protein CYMTET_24734 [Cymbomonas tetramitiformis]
MQQGVYESAAVSPPSTPDDRRQKCFNLTTEAPLAALERNDLQAEPRHTTIQPPTDPRLPAYRMSTDSVFHAARQESTSPPGNASCRNQVSVIQPMAPFIFDGDPKQNFKGYPEIYDHPTERSVQSRRGRPDRLAPFYGASASPQTALNSCGGAAGAREGRRGGGFCGGLRAPRWRCNEETRSRGGGVGPGGAEVVALRGLSDSREVVARLRGLEGALQVVALRGPREPEVVAPAGALEEPRWWRLRGSEGDEVVALRGLEGAEVVALRGLEGAEVVALRGLERAEGFSGS